MRHPGASFVVAAGLGVAAGVVLTWRDAGGVTPWLFPLMLAPVLAASACGRGVWDAGLLAGAAAGVVAFGPSTPPAVFAFLLAWTTAAVTWSSLAPGPTTRACVVAATVGALTWPVWLAPSLSSVPIPMTTFSPVFAINAGLRDVGIWTEEPTAYALTPLGQDLAYALPASPWPAATLYGVLAAAGIGVRFIRGRAARARTAARPPG